VEAALQLIFGRVDQLQGAGAVISVGHIGGAGHGHRPVNR
jgi:hypothetical protein